MLHLGRGNQNYDYLISGFLLPHVSHIKNLGVWFTSDLKFSLHCSNIAKTAFQRSAMVKRCFVSGHVETLIWAFKVFVRPILEYASPVWSPYLVGDIDTIESVQRRFTKSLPGFGLLPYPERLKSANIEPLELRRLHADLILTFLILHRKVDFCPAHFFTLRADGRTRGHPLKLVFNASKKNCRLHFFANRVVHAWNHLPSEVVMASSKLSFKRLLKKVNLEKFLIRNYAKDL